MRINIELLGDGKYRVQLIASNPIARMILRRVSINVSHMSAIGMCGWIVYKDVTDES